MIIENLINIFNSVIPFLVILTVLVFVHELGHYLVAIFNNVKVEVFSIGFGKEIFGFNDNKGTRWKFSMVPLGGYVKMHGDSDEASSGKDESEKIDLKRAYHTKTVGQRSAILFAGPAANFLFSFVVLIFINCAFGISTTKPIITEIIPGQPASSSLLKEGDLITSINGNEISAFEDIKKHISNFDKEKVTLTINRDNKIIDIEVLVKNGLIGIRGDQVFLEKLSFVDSLTSSINQLYFFTYSTLVGIVEIFTGSRGAEELGGPIRIAELSSDFWEKGIHSTLWFMVLISLNLGLINLFPIPLLDGGHLLFNLIEIINGKPLGKRAMEIFHSFGFIVLISLMVFATYNDISRLL